MQWPSKVASRGPGVDPGEFSWRSRWLTLCESRGPPWRPIFKFPLLLVPTVERQKSPLPPRRPRSAMAALRRFETSPQTSQMLKGFGRRPLHDGWASRRGPAFESLARRKPLVGALFGEARPMGISRSPADRMRRRAARRLWPATKTSLLVREHVRVWRRRSGRSGSSDATRSALLCSGARLEGKAIEVARRNARRRS